MLKMLDEFDTCWGFAWSLNSRRSWTRSLKETGRSKSYYAREAIRQYFADREDYLKGIAALERRKPTITLDELERRLGLER